MFALLWRILDPAVSNMTNAHTQAQTQRVSERRRDEQREREREKGSARQAGRTLKAARAAANRTNLMCEQQS